MHSIIHYTSCPLCNSGKIHKALTAKDHTVSGELFDIWECDDCGARFTQDVPDADSIGRYYQSENYISHSNTKRGLINKVYHQVRKITLDQKKKLVQKVTRREKGKLLDIGAGTGLFVETMRKAGWDATGLEPDATARAKAKEMNIALDDTAALFQLQGGQFDAITMWHVLEHVHAIHDYLQHIRTILKHGGMLLIAVPNYTSADAKAYGEYWAAYDVPRHLYHFSPGSMQALFKKHRMHFIGTYPQWFDSYYVSLLSERYKTGKLGVIKGSLNGLRSNIAARGAATRCSSVIYVAERS
ncbi:MAG TPA: class I SAM-dependent methyltransferase [Chitinophagaceae bacterium]|nr:class I SAM-dependent methyltransferase [Chitinophagaceae bacterium]